MRNVALQAALADLINAKGNAQSRSDATSISELMGVTTKAATAPSASTQSATTSSAPPTQVTKPDQIDKYADDVVNVAIVQAVDRVKALLSCTVSRQPPSTQLSDSTQFCCMVAGPGLGSCAGQ